MYFEDPKDTIKAELVEDLDLVTPTALEQALEKVRPNLNVADTAKKQAQEMQDRKGFALLATKFMKE